MLSIKTLSSGVAAAAMAGVLGLAYAQSPSPSSDGAQSPTDPNSAQTQQSAPPADSSKMLPNSSSSTNTSMTPDSTSPSRSMDGTASTNQPSDDLTSSTERAPQADRH